MNKTQEYNSLQLKKDLPEIAPGDTVKIYQKIKEKDKERLQVFEGVVLARKHGKGISSTITVRRVVAGIGVEKIIPLHSPIVSKIEIVKKSKVKRAKLYYLRTAKGRKTRLKRKEFSEVLAPEKTIENPKPEEIK
ncbi:MAG: 50S ribosomal protein L19 [bacterium]|nr:50S ribosomal protein L19 [bacterium]